MMQDDAQTTEVTEPVNAPGRQEIPVEGRAGADVVTGANEFISWGARSDVGLVRGHNEDSFLLRAPLFAVCDGMGGHAAGEVASAIAVETIGQRAPLMADDTLLGAAVEAANIAVMEGAEKGIGKPGMGCTASCALIEKNKMAVAHVGDSRIYLLRHGTLVRVTHDHSYVEELVESGQITADEARVHPSRSIITRALGSDPDMYADHFTLEVNNGDRIILCSDGLSSMVSDSEIETVAMSSATPQQAADNLTSAALTAGGSDNVTVVVVDVINDGVAEVNRKHSTKRMGIIAGVVAGVFLATIVGVFAFVKSEWYLGNNEGTVAIYQGVNAELLGNKLYTLVETTAVAVSDLPDSTQSQLASGIRVNSEEAGRAIVDDYRNQIDQEKNQAAQVASEAAAGTEEGVETNATAADALANPDGTAAEGSSDTENGGE